MIIDENGVVLGEKVVHPEGGEVRTKQSDAASSDINGLLSRYMNSGVTSGNRQTPMYGDFSSGVDFLGCFVQVDQAQQEFRRLPTAVRKRCRNDPAVFLDLVYTPEGRAELAKLGLQTEAIPEAAKPVDPPADPEDEPSPEE